MREPRAAGELFDEESLHPDVPMSDRLRTGVFFTPAPLVSTMLELCAPLVTGSRQLTIVDPACGAGAFLAAAAERFPRARLFGLELAPELTSTCRARVPKAQIIEGDALRGGLDALTRLLPPGGVELWIGNPPYNGTSSILGDAGRFAALRSLLPADLPLPRGTSLRDDFAFFLLLAAHRVAERQGALAFVTSATLLDAFLYAPVREALLRMLSLEHVLELGAGVFSGTRVRTCVTVWARSRALCASHRRRLTEAPGFDPATLGPSVEFTPAAPHWLLRPPSPAAEALDQRWRAQGEPISTLVPVSLPGLKTRFDELLVDDDPERLYARVEAFLATPPHGLEAFAQEHGIPSGCRPKLAVLRRMTHGVAADRGCLRPFLRYAGAKHREGIPDEARAWCYLDRRLIPRGDHRLRPGYDPHGCARKLVFNARELPLCATFVDTPGCVHMHRHARFAPLLVPQRIRDEGLGAARAETDLGPLVPNLSEAGLRWAGRLGGPEQAFRAIAAFLNSAEVQDTWAPAFGASTEPIVPLG